MEVYAWGTSVFGIGDCVKAPTLIPELSGRSDLYGRADEIQGVAAFGEDLMVIHVSHGPCMVPLCVVEDGVLWF